MCPTVSCVWGCLSFLSVTHWPDVVLLSGSGLRLDTRCLGCLHWSNIHRTTFIWVIWLAFTFSVHYIYFLLLVLWALGPIDGNVGKPVMSWCWSVHPTLLQGKISWKLAICFYKGPYEEADSSYKSLGESVSWCRADEWVLGQQLVQIQPLGVFNTVWAEITLALACWREDTSRQPTSSSLDCQTAQYNISSPLQTFTVSPSLGECSGCCLITEVLYRSIYIYIYI